MLGFNPGAVSSSFHESAGGTTSTFPAFIRLSPEAAAQELVQALRRRDKPRVVAGALNRLILFGHRWLPRTLTVNIMGGIGPANGKYVPGTRR